MRIEVEVEVKLEVEVCSTVDDSSLHCLTLEFKLSFILSFKLEFKLIFDIGSVNESGRAEFLSATDDEALASAFELAKLEGIIPALESAHALFALNKIKFGEKDTVVICLSGRGDKDLSTYMQKMPL